MVELRLTCYSEFGYRFLKGRIGMLLLMIMAALAAGTATAVLLWSYGVVIALGAAAFAASAVTLVVAVGLVAFTPSGLRRDGRSENLLLHALSRLLPR